MLTRERLNLPQAPRRTVNVDGSSLGIVSYDRDNGYPQRMISLINACSTAKQAVELLADYVTGQGWDDQRINITEDNPEGTPTNDFYKEHINDRGLTPDGLLKALSLDKARHRGISLHVNYNALYQVVNVTRVPFHTVRLGFGKHAGKICLHADWYNSDRFGGYRKEVDVIPIDPFNLDPAIIQQQVIEAGGWENYRGQILWHSEDGDFVYPLSTIDPVLEAVQAEIQSDRTTTTNLTNNFQLKYIWGERADKEDTKGDAEVVANVQKFIGGEGSQVAVVFSEDADWSDLPHLVKIENMMNDKLFAYTDEKVRAKIYRSFRQPAILHSDYMGTNGYNEGQLPQSMEYYNNYTHPERIFFEELFTQLFTNFVRPINPTGVYSIVPLANIKVGASKDKPNADTTTNI